MSGFHFGSLLEESLFIEVLGQEFCDLDIKPENTKIFPIEEHHVCQTILGERISHGDLNRFYLKSVSSCKTSASRPWGQPVCCSKVTSQHSILKMRGRIDKQLQALAKNMHCPLVFVQGKKASDLFKVV